MKVFGNAGSPDHDAPLFNLHPATFDEWFAGLNNRPPSQRPGQWAVNTLTPELWTAVNGTPFDAFHINERLPDLIRYARHWWGVMEVSKDGASIPACVFVAVQRGKVPSDTDGCAAEVDADDACRAVAIAHHVALEIAVIDGTATDEQIAEYVKLRDASWARDGSRIVVKPPPIFYDFDHDCDPTKERP